MFRTTKSPCVVATMLLLGCTGSQATGGHGDPSTLFPPGSVPSASASAGTPSGGEPVATAPSGLPPLPVAPSPTLAAPAGCAANVVKLRERSKEVVEPRIVGGLPSTEFKGVVALSHDGTMAGQFCGGSLIKDQWVLTAAHCRVSASDKVIVGVFDLSKIPPSAIQSVDRVLEHAHYNEKPNDNDIALIKLAKPLAATADKVALYKEATFPDGVKGTVVGWGLTKENGERSPKLLEVDVPFVTNEKCKTAYGDGITITDNMVCAGEAGKHSCQGDSGGPIGPNGGGAWRQAGIVSFGAGCARPNVYGVYTRVSKYIDWIDACTK